MKPHQGPSANEIRLRGEVDRLRRELNKLKKAAAAAAAAGGAPPAPGSATTATPASPTPAPAPGPAPVADGNHDALRQKIQELETTKERLGKLYFAQLDENRRRQAELHEILRVASQINADLGSDLLLQRIANSIQTTLGFRIVLIRVRQPGTHLLKAGASAGLDARGQAALEAEDVRLE